jgi:hypothetical protein
VRHHSLLTAALIATLAVGLTGCSRNPVAPAVDATAAPTAGPMGVSLEPEDAPPVDGGTPLARTISLSLSDEGVFAVGRFTIEVRKNSLSVPTTITVHVTDPEALVCEVEVSPPGTSFQSPVLLSANTSDIAGFDYATATMFSWSSDWQELPNTASHPNQQNVVGHIAGAGTFMVGPGGGKKNKIGA